MRDLQGMCVLKADVNAEAVWQTSWLNAVNREC
jgi:hypothetical protein